MSWKINCRPAALLASLWIASLWIATPALSQPGTESRAPGTVFIYRLVYQNRSAADFRALFGGQSTGAAAPAGAAGLTNSFGIRIAGEWVVTALSNGEKEQKLTIIHPPKRVPASGGTRLEAAAIRFWTNGQEAPDQAAALKAELGKEIVVRVAGGRVRSVQFAESVPPFARNVARTLLGLLQWADPSPGPSPSPAARVPGRGEKGFDNASPSPFRGGGWGEGSRWTAEEENPNGRYLARYQRQKDGSIAKQKLRYLVPQSRLRVTSGEIRPTVLPEGRLIARFDREGGLIQLTGKESEKLVIRRKLVGKSVTTLSLTRIGKRLLTPSALAALRTTVSERTGKPVRLSADVSPAEREAAIQRQELGDATLESLLAELDAFEAEAKRAPDSPPLGTALYLKLKALVYLQPETSAAIGARLSKAEPNGVVAQLLTGVLVQAGHAPAQAALIEAIRTGPGDPAPLERGIAALAGTPNPSPATIDAMQEWARTAPTRDLQVMARLSLGTLARALLLSGRPSEKQRAGVIVSEIERGLAKTEEKEELKLGLMALGNAGAVRSLPTLTRYLTHPSASVRATAVSALRFIDDPRADLLLLQRLEGDPAAAVREAAASAMSDRLPTPGTIRRLQKAFAKEKLPGIRLLILTQLAPGKEEFPELLPWLKQVAARDPDPGVRNAAAQLVGAEAK